MQWWKLWGGPPDQRYYPQCNGCSQVQSTAMRTDTRRLVGHFRFMRLPYLAGAAVRSLSMNRSHHLHLSCSFNWNCKPPDAPVFRQHRSSLRVVSSIVAQLLKSSLSWLQRSSYPIQLMHGHYSTYLKR